MPRTITDPMTARIDMRLSTEMIAGVDEWRRHEDDIPPRSEAMRRLMGHGLRTATFRQRVLLCVDAVTVGGTDAAVASRMIREEILFLLYDLDVKATDADKVMEILLELPAEPSDQTEG